MLNSPQYFLSLFFVSNSERYTIQKKWQLVEIVVVQCNASSRPPEVFLRKDIPKIYSKFTGKHPCRSVISIKLLCNFIEITFRHGCSPVNLLYIFGTSFRKSTSRGMFLVMRYFEIKH